MRMLWAMSFVIIIITSLPAIALAKGYDHGHGLISMKGTILDAACAIDLQDREQAIELGVETTGEIIHDGHGPRKPFSIHLIHCNLSPYNPAQPDWSRFMVTFDGDRDDGLFGLQGAHGIGVQISDTAGNIAVPGEPMPAGQLITGHQQLDYNLSLVSDRHRLISGNYHAIVRFKVDYF